MFFVSFFQKRKCMKNILIIDDVLFEKLSKGRNFEIKIGVPNFIDSKNRDLGTSGKLIFIFQSIFPTPLRALFSWQVPVLHQAITKFCTYNIKNARVHLAVCCFFSRMGCAGPRIHSCPGGVLLILHDAGKIRKLLFFIFIFIFILFLFLFYFYFILSITLLNPLTICYIYEEKEYFVYFILFLFYFYFIFIFIL